MADTPRLDLPYLAASQAQKEVYHNISLDRLDLLVQCAVLDRNLSTPPASPAEGDAYIVGPTATGAWAGHETHLALWVNSQWELIAPLPGFQCWILDEAVQVYWAGSAWTLTGSGGGGATTLLGLSDTPDSYGGQAGKTLLVNPGETAMVFGTLPGSAPVDATYIVTSSHASLSAERVVTDNTQIAWDAGTAGQLAGTLVGHGVTLDKLAQQAPGTLLGVGGDALGPLADVQPILLGIGLEMLGSTLNATGGGGGASTFVELTDTPDSYAGQAGKGVTVNGAATGLEFTTAVTGSYDLGLTWAGTLPASQVLLRYPFPRAVDFPAGLTGSRGVSAMAATATTTLDLRHNNVSVGSVQWAAAATTATFTMAAATSFAAGDVLTVHAPASADTTLADLGLSLAGTRAVAAGEMGATTWLGLTDTPDAYTGQGGNLVTVNSGATALDYAVLTAFARTLLDDTTQAAMRTTLGLTPGTDVQAQDAELQAIAGLTSAADTLPYFTGSGTAALATFTTAGRNLVDDVDAAAQRTTLGLGTMATQNANAVAITGGTAVGLSALALLSGNLDITSGNLTVTNGAVGFSTAALAGVALTVGGKTVLGSTPGGGAAQVGITYDRTATHGVLLQGANTDAAGPVHIAFVNAAGLFVGTIATTATTTAYNTASDVRLKRSVQSLTGVLERVRALRPVSYFWNVDESPGEGFIAHELMVPCPLAVTGLPDEVHPDGSIKPQQVDHSRLMPLAIAGMKELLAMVESLTARVTTLEQSLGL